jgi:vancomycin resistance protein YoaR
MKHKKLIIFFILAFIVIIIAFSGGVYYKNNTPVITVSYTYKDSVIKTSEYKLSSNFKVTRAYNKKRLNSLYQGLYSSSGSFKASLNFICPKISSDILEIEDKISKSPQNANVIIDKTKNEPFVFINEIYGESLNINQLINYLFQNIDNRNISMKIELPVDSIPPDVDAESLKNRFTLLSSFSTVYVSSPSNRKDNIALATSFINGTEIKSGETFSYNTIVGPRTIDRGFKIAKIISGGTFIEGVGGGVCQVSSTLYDTALLSGVIGIIKRQNHSLPVSYIPLGLDAMVSSTNDLTFVNLSLTSIFIIGKTDGYKITFSIYGEKQNQKIKLKD